MICHVPYGLSHIKTSQHSIYVSSHFTGGKNGSGKLTYPELPIEPTFESSSLCQLSPVYSPESRI